MYKIASGKIGHKIFQIQDKHILLLLKAPFLLMRMSDSKLFGHFLQFLRGGKVKVFERRLPQHAPLMKSSAN